MPVDAKAPEIVATSVYKFLMLRMGRVHLKEEMGAFAGPPGLGKTTVATQFVAEHPGEAVRVTLGFPNAKEVMVQQAMLTAIRRGQNLFEHHCPNNKYELGRSVQNAVESWAWALECAGRAPRMTVVFDEAQNLSPIAIEALRHWNDAPDGGPKLSFVFLGNDQFRLEDDSRAGPSFLSAAVASRCPYRRVFSYADLSDDDLALIIEAKGIVDPAAVDLLVRHRRSLRDLRLLTFQLNELVDSGRPLTAPTVRNFVGIG